MKRLAVIAAAVLILAAAALVTGYRMFVGTPTHPMTQAQADAMIRHDVPVGSDVTDVQAWLARKGFEHCFESARGTDWSGTDLGERGYDQEKLSGTEVAIIRDTDRRFMVTGSLQLTFFFDRSRRLIDHRVRRVGTGP